MQLAWQRATRCTLGTQKSSDRQSQKKQQAILWHGKCEGPRVSTIPHVWPLATQPHPPSRRRMLTHPSCFRVHSMRMRSLLSMICKIRLQPPLPLTSSNHLKASATRPRSSPPRTASRQASPPRPAKRLPRARNHSTSKGVCRQCKTKKDGHAGNRTPDLSHAKRACYHCTTRPF